MKKRIVLIENDNELRQKLTLMFEELGYQVTAYPKVEDIEALLALPANLYIIEEKLPGINGHTLCIILKSKQSTRHVPVILISGAPELIAMATLSDADRFLAKPFRPEDLQKIIDEIG